MAARKPTGYKVIGAAAVVREGKAERYLYRGAIFAADTINEDNAKHLLSAGLIEAVTAPAKTEEKAPAKASKSKSKAEAAASDSGAEQGGDADQADESA